jgi:hypothetical protein
MGCPEKGVRVVGESVRQFSLFNKRPTEKTIHPRDQLGKSLLSTLQYRRLRLFLGFARGARTSAKPDCSLLRPEALSIRRDGERESLALPLDQPSQVR